MTSSGFVGMDVSKRRLDVNCFGQGEVKTFGNDAEGWQRLIAWLKQWEVELLVCEATGGYERNAVRTLIAAGLPVAVANPTRVRRFAEGLGLLAKTDRIDACLIAWYASVAKPPVHRQQSKLEEHLADIVERRRQLVTVLTAEKNRLSTCSAIVRAEIQEHIVWMEDRIHQYEHEIHQLIQQCDDWRTRAKLLDSTIGVGPVTAATLVADLPELGQLSRQKIAALAGLAPFNKDSGAKRGKRRIKGGRESIRHTLYMATLSATQHNPVIKSFYQRLLRYGKEKKVAITACMRKFLVILNAMIRKGEAWLPIQT